LATGSRDVDKEAPPGSPGGKRGKVSKRGSSKVIVVEKEKEEKEVPVSTFGKEAMKLGHPEFQKYLSDLDAAFQPLDEVMPEKVPENVLVLSSIPEVHFLPLECVSMFGKFAVIYKDQSIMGAMNRKGLSTDPPNFGV
jgi:hypothetical protein